MGNCCTGSPTDGNTLEVPEKSYPTHLPLQAPNYLTHAVAPEDMVDYSFKNPSEPQQLEHIADREGLL